MFAHQAKRFLHLATAYRFISIALVVLLFITEENRYDIPVITVVLLCLATAIMSIVYWQLFENTNVVKNAVRIELWGMLFVYIYVGGMANPLVWFLINPILFDLYFFYNRHKIMMYIPIFIIGSVLGVVLSDNVNYLSYDLESAGMLVPFLLILELINLLASYQQQLTLNIAALTVAKDKLDSEVNVNSQTANWLEKSYQMVERLIGERNLNKGMEMIINYASMAVPCYGVCIVMEDRVYGTAEVRNKLDHGDYLPIKIELEGIDQHAFIAFVYHIRDEGRVQDYIYQMRVLAQITILYYENMQLSDQNRQLIVEGEQKRIANEIHDGIQQQLAGTVYMLHNMAKRGQQMSKESIIEGISLVYKELSGASKSLRHTIYHLADSGVIEGWKTKITDECDLLCRKYEANVALSIEGDELAQIETVYFKSMLRVLREGISNAVNHGNASEISVRVLVTFGEVFISVSDDGEGFFIDDTMSYGLGLYNLKRIAELYNGVFSIDSQINEGTTVQVSMMVDMTA